METSELDLAGEPALTRPVMSRLGWSFFGCLALTACHARAPSDFVVSDTASAGYRIRSRAGSAPGSSAILPPAWELDNYFTDPATHALRPKPGPEYHITYELDGDGDGVPEIKESAELYQLRFVHAQLQATLWLRAFPIARSLQHTDMDVLLKDYVDEISHVGYEAVRLDPRPNLEKPRFATHITREVIGKLAGTDALDADVEVANLDQLAVNQNTSWHRMRLILARGPSAYQTKSGQTFPTMIVLAYASWPEQFVNADADFEDILARFSIGQAAGFVPVVWPHGPPIAPPLPNFSPPPTTPNAE